MTSIKRKMIKRLALSCLVLGLASVYVGARTIKSHRVAVTGSETFLREHTLMLRGNNVSCTAVEVIAPSGESYVLSARHCSVMATVGKILAIDEQGRLEYLDIIALDKNSDLMLLSAHSDSGLRIAKSVVINEHIHTMTHGAGKPLYRTDGVLLDEESIMFRLGDIEDQKDFDACTAGPQQSVVFSPAGPVCALTLIDVATTAKVVPGSSGGPAVNEHNELIGIASATDSDGNFGYFVRLKDIQRFLAGR